MLFLLFLVPEVVGLGIPQLPPILLLIGRTRDIAVIGLLRVTSINYDILGSDKCSSRPRVGPVLKRADNGTDPRVHSLRTKDVFYC